MDVSSSSKSPAHVSNEQYAESDVKNSAAAIENARKVGSEQHQRTMKLLVEKFVPSTSMLTQTTQTAQAQIEAGVEESKKEFQRRSSEKAEQSEKKEGATLSPSNPENAEAAAFEELKKETQKSKANAEAASEKNTTASGTGNNQPISTEGETIGGEKPDKPTTLPLLPPKPPNPPAFPEGFAVGSIGAKEFVSYEASLTKILAQMSELMGDSALESLDANRQHQKRSSEVNLAEIKKSEKEQIEAQRKANQASTIGGAILQGLMGLGALIMGVFGVVTGNVALITVSVLSLTLVIADSALAAAGKETISGAIMAPIMENVIQPMAEFFGDIIENFLLDLGVDPDTAAIVGSVLGMLMAFASIILIAVGLKSSTAVNQAMSKLLAGMGSALSKMTPEALKTAAKGMSQSMGQFSTKLMEKASGGAALRTNLNSSIAGAAPSLNSQQTTAIVDKAVQEMVGNFSKVLTANVQLTTQSTALASALVGGATGVTSSVYGYQVSEAKTDLLQRFQTMEALSSMLQTRQDAFKDIMEESKEMMESALALESEKTKTAQAILQNMSKGI